MTIRIAAAYLVGTEGTNTLLEDERAQGCEDEFALLVFRQHRFVMRVAFALLRNTQDSEDVAQEVFLKLYRSGKWRGIRDERAFLAKVAWRMAIDMRRGSAREEADESLDGIASGLSSPEEHAMNESGMARIHRLIDSLPEQLRQPLVLSGIDEMTSREIGAVLGISDGTVRTRLMRARQLLKEKIATKGGRP